jgi:hypothetical protein
MRKRANEGGGRVRAELGHKHRVKENKLTERQFRLNVPKERREERKERREERAKTGSRFGAFGVRFAERPKAKKI